MNRYSVLLLLIPAVAAADEVRMKNGDRLSGSIVRADGKTLVMKSEFAGQVTIPWDAITGIESADPLYVTSESGQVIVGTVTIVENEFAVATADAGTVMTPRTAVTGIRSSREQEIYETEIDRFRNPRLIDLWTGNVDLGYSETSGNADTNTITVGANASRATNRDKIAVGFTSLYASNETTGVSIVTANAIRGGINYSLNLTPKAYTFASLDLEFDEFQSLDLRFVPAGGFGYNMIKNRRTLLAFQGGASVNREFFSTGLKRTSGEGLAGNEFTHKFNDTLAVRQKFVIFPNLTEPGDFRMNFDAGLTAALSRWLSWQITVSDRFLSNPVPGRQKNDVLLSTGLRLSFQQP
ncbi:MAG: DUF481 domain-containing protein [Bryobacterales bacterium]|jgi:putative salt-induced outer membrane protein YdiY|nr:DUF481 domain-containing protein [Bryobacterales bacterium]